MHTKVMYRHVTPDGQGYILHDGVAYRISELGYTSRAFIYTLSANGKAVQCYTLSGARIEQRLTFISARPVQCCYRSAAIAVPESLRNRAGFRFSGYQAEVVEEPLIVLE